MVISKDIIFFLNYFTCIDKFMDTTIIIIVIGIFVTGLAFILLKKIVAGQGSLPYRQQDKLFTPAERSFYGVLCQAVKDKAVVMGKVRVADVITTSAGLNASDRQKAFNKISAKHFDFVLCNPEDLSVIAVVELDDSSHGQKKRVARDQFLNAACDAADLKLHRFKASRGYNPTLIREQLFPSKPSEPGRVEPILGPIGGLVKSDDESRVCPQCSSLLVRRTSKKGKNRNKTFLACDTFPVCSYIEEI